MIFLSHLGKPSHVDLPELEVGESVLAGDLGEDAGEVNAGRGPGSVESDHPDHVLVPVDLLADGVVPEVDDVLRALVGGLRQQQTLQEEQKTIDKAESRVGHEEKDGVGDLGVHEAVGEIVDHGDVASLAGSDHDNDDQEEEYFCLSHVQLTGLLNTEEEIKQRYQCSTTSHYTGPGAKRISQMGLVSLTKRKEKARQRLRM